MTRIQFARRPDRRGSALGSTPRALWHPWPSNHLSVCGHLQPCGWSAWPTSFQAAKQRMWSLHWADAQHGTSDAPPQQGTSQPKVRVGEQSAEIQVVAAPIRLRGRDQASKKWPTSWVNSQMLTLNTHRPSVKCSLSACLSVCLSLSLNVCLCLCLSVRCVPASVGLVCGVRCQRAPHLFSDLCSQTLPLVTSLFTLPQYAASAMDDHG